MKKLISFYSLILICLITQAQAPSIVGGSDVRIEDVPWQVALMEKDGGQFCGGSIIDSSWVLTAAHCLEGATPEAMEIGYGIQVLSGDQIKRVSVEAIIVHSMYDRYTTQNDIALIKIDGKFDLSDKAKMIPLMTKSLASQGFTNHGVISRISGWGLLEEGGFDSSDTLQMVEVGIVSNDTANAEDKYNGAITDDMLAAGDLVVGGKDACQGDSGGPLAVYGPDSVWYLAGVVSWGEGCAQADHPGIYARVSYFNSWVNGIKDGGPIAGFSQSADAVFEGDSIQFTNLSINDPIDYKWNFHGGSPDSSSLENPVIIYENEGYYDVELIVSNSKGADTITLENAVFVRAKSLCDSSVYLEHMANATLILEAFDTGWDDDEGYFAGSHSWSPEGVFEAFEPEEDRSVSGAKIKFAKAVGNNDDEVEVALFEIGAAEPLLSKAITIEEIKTDIENGRSTKVDFGGALLMPNGFYLGVLLPDNENDTIAIYSTESNEDHALTFYGEWDGFGDWYTFQEDYSMSRSLAISAIVCKISSDTDISIEIGIEEIKEKWNIYPNPVTNGILNIQGVEHIDLIKIYNVQGQVVLSKIVDGTQIQLQTEGIDKGIYFIELSNHKGIQRVKLMIE